MSLYAQPIVDVSSGRVAQSELLLRVHAQGSGPSSPGPLLQQMEGEGTILDLDRWVLDRGVAHSAKFDVPLQINISGTSMSHEGLGKEIEGSLERHGADPGSLVFEVTETAPITDIAAAAQNADVIRDLGCGLALDDFGTGYWTMFHIKHLPITELKVDGEFIRTMPESRVDRAIVRSAVNLAGELGIATVAEYVGNDETLSYAREIGIDYAQGAHLGMPRPLRPDELSI